ncbi:hypothetical protein Selin_2517 [Desulfurispirillum indicum S5]|uniref:Outer membrane protein beta-barrel domain-containing protein n=1 Tax=Desulfurispirillum indicum (strain ATCC BAA-1389 / DSM 22839 / S5) TaxID=653733 RepID=E6W5U5_DESIS|nr:hypothetical protein [Desulfurispirillum indicum]ADU67230.1 hypothetical protein Selin_2517 [Desulfurispirillum indicum S5]
MLKAKRLGIIGGVLAGSLVLAASASALPLESHVGATYGIPSEGDNGLELEVGTLYSHESGFYAGATYFTNDLLDDDWDFSDYSYFEITFGYEGEAGAIGYDLGFLKTMPMDSDIDDNDEVYAGVLFAPTEELGLSAYYYMNLDSDLDADYVELGAEYDLGVAVASYLYTMGIGDNDEKTSEIGISKEFIPSHEFGLFYTVDHDDSDNSVLELSWTYSF